MRGSRVNGSVIRQLRTAKGLTQAQLAERADLDETTLRKMEKGERSFDVRSIVDLAEALDCDLIMLLANDPGDCQMRQQERANLNCVAQYRQSFLEKDVERTLARYTDDAVVSYPSSIPSDSSGKFVGTEEIREHLKLTFQTFTSEIPTLEDSDVYAFEDRVIVRHVGAATVLHNTVRFESECLIEFWFRDGKICKHVGLFDTAVMAEALNAPNKHSLQ